MNLLVDVQSKQSVVVAEEIVSLFGCYHQLTYDTANVVPPWVFKRTVDLAVEGSWVFGGTFPLSYLASYQNGWCGVPVVIKHLESTGCHKG